VDPKAPSTGQKVAPRHRSTLPIPFPLRPFFRFFLPPTPPRLSFRTSSRVLSAVSKSIVSFRNVVLIRCRTVFSSVTPSPGLGDKKHLRLPNSLPPITGPPNLYPLTWFFHLFARTSVPPLLSMPSWRSPFPAQYLMLHFSHAICLPILSSAHFLRTVPSHIQGPPPAKCNPSL